MEPIRNRILFPKVTLNPQKLKSLSGRRVLITGASFGIGLQLSLQLAKFGCRLILVARTEEKLKVIQKQCLAIGAEECDFYVCDLYNPAEVDDLCSHLKKHYTHINFFVSNAGKSIMRSFAQSKDRPQDISRTQTVNFLSPLTIIQKCYDLLTAGNAHIINVSALNVLLPPTPYWATYESSKRAFDTWCRSNAPEWENDGVLLQTVYLPLVDTRMAGANKAYVDTPKMKADQAAARIVRLLYSKKRVEKPWWSYSFFMLRPFERIWGKIILRNYSK